jgi:hypothetical protein
VLERLRGLEHSGAARASGNGNANSDANGNGSTNGKATRDWESLAEELASDVEGICSTLLDMYLDLPVRAEMPAGADAERHSNSSSGSGSGSGSNPNPNPNPNLPLKVPWLAPAPTRNGPLLERALRSLPFMDLYYACLTRPSVVDPKTERENDASASTTSASASASTDGPIATRTRTHPTPPYIPPHARPLSPSLAVPLRDPDVVTGPPVLARLHALLPVDPADDREIYDLRERQHRGYLRELVYGRRHYRADNDYGPLRPDGRVDWHLVNAIATVMSEWNG